MTATRERALRKPESPRKDDDTLAIEIHELGQKDSYTERDVLPDSRGLPPPFDFERLTRFMSYGFLMAPLQYKWFGFLARAFPITKSLGTGPALKRVAFDQLIFSPMSTFA
ncbi:hypothetical protein FH972_021927 [Carpinus fangiana]|uniref:Uncharacterized protein n=1 Tax=Carpinus fangiana TaxID=176857 RepID=A0A5N6KR40_9ROSI|nr:hypothetical protein FH972_021927 [Carpinus fangiana]